LQDIFSGVGKNIKIIRITNPKNNMNHSILTFVFVILFGISGLTAESALTEIPSCGIASTYGILLHFEQETPLETIKNRFSELYPDSDSTIMSISQLEHLIRSFGLHTLSVKTDLSELRNEQLPAIICVTNTTDEQKLPVAHVLLLRQINGDTAILTDYQVGINPFEVPLDDLQKMSEGKILLVDSKPISVPSMWSIAVSILTMFTSFVGIVAVALSFWRSYKSKSNQWTITPSCSLTGLMLICFLLTGCGSKESSSDPAPSNTAIKNSPPIISEKKPTIIYPPKVPKSSPENSSLHFENCIKDYGVFLCGRDYFKVGEGGKKIEFEFPFTVGKNDVMIETIDVTCGCIVSDQEIIGKKLPSSSEQMLKVVMDVGGRCGRRPEYISIVTKPESPQPIVLKAVVFVKQLPEVPRDLQVRGLAGKKVDAEININYLRDKTLPQIELDLEQCDFADFQMKSNKFTVRESMDIPAERRDHLLVELESNQEYDAGKHETEITLAWKEKEFTPVKIPIKFQIEPPFRLSLDRAFVGEVNPGETKTVLVRLISNNVKETVKVNIVQNVDGVTVKQEDGKMIVTVKSPEQAGRFEKSFQLTFPGETEPIVFPISGIVKPK
jgi:hypothetical protein